MLEQRYSRPEFDPYGEAGAVDPNATDEGWAAPLAGGPLAVRMTLPGSKSLTNRELVLAALADGPGLLRAPLRSRDTDLMAQAVNALGAVVTEAPGTGGFGPDWLVAPGELFGGGAADCGLAGTVIRFPPPVAALGRGPVVFDGDERARPRPMSTIIDALRALGVDLDDNGTGRLPFTVHGAGSITGGDLEIDASASSQFVSALLLAAPRFERGLRLRHTGERLPSLPHIEMTIACLAARGVVVETPEPGLWIVEPQVISAIDVDIEPDLSNAAPFLAAALVAGGSVTIDGWPSPTTQVGALLPSLLTEFGATASVADGALTIDGGPGLIGGGRIAGVDLDLSLGGELAPTLVGLAALADSPSRIVGIGHLRGHETDRLAALVADIEALGGIARELPDGLEIEPAPLTAGLWRAEADHRIATTGALIGLAIPGVVVDDIATTSKTLPEFPELWAALLR